MVRRGMGAQVKVTVRKRKGFRPNTSDNAPIIGALRNDSIPWWWWGGVIRLVLAAFTLMLIHTCIILY